VARIDTFVTAIEHHLSRLTAILNAVQFVMVALTIGSAIALLYSAYLFIFNPLARLQAGLARVEAGDLGARVRPRAPNDEFGALAAGFNRMAEPPCRACTRTSKSKVQEKTEHPGGRAFAPGGLVRVGRVRGMRAESLDALAQGIARQVRQVARADASAVRWSDEANQRYVLIAGDCLPLAMAEDEHCVHTGACLCGQRPELAATRVIQIHAEHSRLSLHCANAGFQSLITVPVMAQHRVIGEIDLFFREPTTLGDEDRQHLDALASHLASAMEGLRAEALERESAVAEERGLLARELHDSIAQSLSFLKIQVGLLRSAVRRTDAAAVSRTLDELDAGVRESTADVRELLVHFRTRTNGEDIVPALKTTLQKFEHQTGLPTHLEVHGAGLPLPPDVQVQVLHVVQEALSNVRKHAQAQEVWIELAQGPEWSVEVRDDGRGFDAAAGPAGEMHVGLRIMRERAERIGATVQVDSVPGAGTCVVLRLPSRQEALAA
jgi:two-component system nitrate/nitrite sensor histidine kinase NarX